MHGKVYGRFSICDVNKCKHTHTHTHTACRPGRAIMSVTSDLSAAICPLMKPYTVARHTHTHTFFLHSSKSHAQQQQQTNIYTCTLSMKAAETQDKTQAKITNVTILPFLFIAIFSVCVGLWV